MPLAERFIRGLSKLAVLATVWAGLIAPVGSQTFTKIEFPGAMHTRLFGITPGGDIVGLYINPDGRFHGLVLNRNE